MQRTHTGKAAKAILAIAGSILTFVAFPVAAHATLSDCGASRHSLYRGGSYCSHGTSGFHRSHLYCHVPYSGNDVNVYGAWEPAKEWSDATCYNAGGTLDQVQYELKG